MNDPEPKFQGNAITMTPVSDNCVLPTLEHSLWVGRAGPSPPQDHKSGTVCRPISDYVGCHRPVQADTGEIFIRIVRPQC